MFSDFRELNADDSIDAVQMSLPEHWHSIPSLDAILHGKHMYYEKPMTMPPTPCFSLDLAAEIGSCHPSALSGVSSDEVSRSSSPASELAGVWTNTRVVREPTNLIHLPDELAGVVAGRRGSCSDASCALSQQ